MTPNVAAIYRIGTLHNRPYLVTELVRGDSLAKTAKPMAWQAVLDIAILAVRRGRRDGFNPYNAHEFL